MKQLINAVVQLLKVLWAWVCGRPTPVEDQTAPDPVEVNLRTIRASITVHTPRRTSTVLKTVIIDSSQPDPKIVKTKVPTPWTRQSLGCLVLDEFGRLHSYCQDNQVVGDIYVGFPPVRELLGPVAARFPWAKLVATLPEGDRSIIFDPTPVPTPHPKPPKPVKPPTPRLAVATDGSAAMNRRPGLGWACIAADGRHAIGHCQSGSNPWVAELRAVELALQTFDGPLDIHTDCQPMINWVMNPSSIRDRHNQSRAKRVNRMLTRTHSNLIWVKGHAGHPLNEKADRLARIARLELKGMYQGSAAMVADRVAHERMDFA